MLQVPLLATSLCLMPAKVGKSTKPLSIQAGFIENQASFLQEYLVHTGAMQYGKYTRLFYFSIVNVRETSVYEGAHPRIVQNLSKPIACPITVLPGRFPFDVRQHITKYFMSKD